MNWGKLTVSRIRSMLKEMRASPEVWFLALSELSCDERKGVHQAVRTELNVWAKDVKRKSVAYQMLKVERELWQEGYQVIAGIDEAGRGPLAGPVVAAAVILPAYMIDELGCRDSKQMSHIQRVEAYHHICRHATAVGIGVVTPRLIDRLNILQATFLAMRQALGQINVEPDIVLIDGHLKIPDLALTQRPIVGGDNKVRTIAAASIVAKVYRDQLMQQIDGHFQLYGFSQNKGYPTFEHRQRVRQFGSAVVHRLSFMAVNESE